MFWWRLRGTCECLVTQWRSTFKTLLVAALLMTNSLSPFLWSVGKPAARTVTIRALLLYPHTLWLIVLIFSNITRQLPELFSINIINEAKHKSRLPWEHFDMIVQFEGIFKVDSQKCLLITWRTCAGQWHTPVLLLGWGAFVGASSSNGKGWGSRKSAAVIVQLPTGRNHHAIVEGKKGKFCREGNRTLIYDEYNFKFQKERFYCHKVSVFCEQILEKKSHFAIITGLLSNRGQQRAKTRAARCVLQLVLWRCTIHHVCFTPSSSSAHTGAVWENMHIVAKVQGFLPPTHTSHWLPLHPAPWEANTLGMNWLPTGWMLPLYAA